MTVLPKTKKGVIKERPIQPGPSRSPTSTERRPPSPTNRKTRRNHADLSAASSPPSKKGYRSRSNSPDLNSDDERSAGFRDDQLELQFIDRLRTSKGWQIKQMQGDGACLFRAVADQVYGDQEMHGEVRRLCMDYMERNRDHFAEFVTEDFDNYILRKRLPQTHGNHVEIQAISEMYARPVEIYEYSDQPNNTFNPRSTAEMNAPLRLSYHGGVHYNAVVDPDAATIGVGLGLPGHVPGAADAELMTDTMRQSEMSHIEETMLHDKLHMSDWQKTDEEIKDQVSRESYMEYVRSLESRKQKSPIKPEDVPCGSRTVTTAPLQVEDKPCSSKQPEEKPAPGLYEELLLMGAVDWEDEGGEDSAMVAQALLMSQQQFMEELQKKGDQSRGDEPLKGDL